MARLSKPNREDRRLLDRIHSLQIHSETTATYLEKRSGPLPDPETLAKYDQLMPGVGNRIVQQFESESGHRREMEKKLLDAQIGDAGTYREIEKRGQTCATIVASLIIIGGFVAIGMGHSVTGSILSGGTLVTLTSVFIYGRERKVAEAKEQRSLNDKELPAPSETTAIQK